MQCPNCQRENRGDARFCTGCGASLALHCPACGRELELDAGFCDRCGQSLAETAPTAEPPADPRAYTPKHLADRILTSRSAIEGERKHVTVLFADVAGFTPLSESSDPEQVYELMDRCFERILHQVHQYEGTINQFLGDGVMALFGAPLALEDAPHRAVMAALGIHEELATLDTSLGNAPPVELRMRIGINTGLVVVGKIGDDLRMDYTAVGDTTNLASRLQELATPGTIVISEATHRLVSGFFEMEDLGAIAVRGKSVPVRAYRVLEERRITGRIEAMAEVGLTPFVGRARELGTLKAAFETARDGHGQAAFVVGEAGIGKSRLLLEFRESLADAPHRWFEGRCFSYGRTTAFQCLIDGLRRQFAIDDRDDDAAAAEKLAGGVAALGNDLQWTLPFLRQLLSLPTGDSAVAELAAVARRGETMRALQALLLRVAEREPLVFVIEDLHWIDPAAEEFLELLIDAIPASRACVVLTHRPGYRHPFGDRSYHERVALQSLSPEEMASMARFLLESDALPGELGELIARKADGNPFFVEEVTKSLVEDGTLRVEGGEVGLTRELHEVEVPDSLLDVIMARIDRLDDGPKRAIQVASVIGREFAFRLLERIQEAGDSVREVVGELRALELILQKTAHPELAFMFKHALTRDVAYGSVLVQRRKVLHRIVATAIEELYPDRLAEHYEALAHHYALADSWEKALEYHELAANKALAAYANRSAADHAEAALEIAERLGDAVSDERHAALAAVLGRAHMCVNRFRAAAEAFGVAAERSPDPPERARNLARSAHAYVWGHHYDEATLRQSQALSAARAAGAAAGEALALAACDLHALGTRGFSEALRDVGEESLLVADRSGDPEAVTTAFGLAGVYAGQRGRYARAIELASRALEAARKTGLAAHAITPRWTIGLARTGLGEYGAALSELLGATEFCSQIGDRALKSRILNTVGWCYAEVGADRRAIEFNQASAEIARELLELDLVAGAPELLANSVINLSGNRVALGDPDGAGELLEPVLERLEHDTDPWARWRYSMHMNDARARLALARGEHERALSLLEQELEGARQHVNPKAEARALELRGRVLVELDDRETATAALTGALEVARAIGYPPVTWRALSLLAELARREGERARAEQLGAETRALVDRLSTSFDDADLRRDFAALGLRLVEDPLGAYR